MSGLSDNTNNLLIGQQFREGLLKLAPSKRDAYLNALQVEKIQNSYLFNVMFSKDPCKSSEYEGRVLCQFMDPTSENFEKICEIHNKFTSPKIKLNKPKTSKLQKSTTKIVKEHESETLGHLYLLREREFINSNESVYKIGKSENISTRLKKYPKGSELIIIMKSNNVHEDEKQLIEVFDKNYNNRKDIGREYYEGNVEDMIELFTSTILAGYKNPNKLINDDVKLEDEIRNILHQNEYESVEEYDLKDGIIKCKKLRFDFDAQNDESNDRNNKLINLFSSYFGGKIVAITSAKGILKSYITDKKYYETKGIIVTEHSSNETVKIIMDIIKRINTLK